MLFCGSPGTGKTLLANLAAKEMGVLLHERIAQVVNSMEALNGLLLQAEHKDIVFLDEIHERLPSVQTLLYRAMEGQQISARTRDERTLSMPLKDFTLIGATTDEYRRASIRVGGGGANDRERRKTRNISDGPIDVPNCWQFNPTVPTSWIDRPDGMRASRRRDWNRRRSSRDSLAYEGGGTRGSRFGSYFRLVGGVPHLKSASSSPFLSLNLRSEC